MKYEIENYEISTKTKVVVPSIIEAPGIIEAMLEYLPWPILQLEINYRPDHGHAIITDLKTDFIYKITIPGEIN